MFTRSTIIAILLAGTSAAGMAWSVSSRRSDMDEARLRLAEARRVAPGFVGLTNWLNSGPLSIGDLRGKVVFVDFWTYGCYNCVNTLPYVKRLHEAYKDKGLVIVGVHTPEFPREKSLSNVQAAVKRHGIQYPVAQDNEYATWRAYKNQYWPAQYIVDQKGFIVFEHAGEGQYDKIEQTIKNLLAAEG